MKILKKEDLAEFFNKLSKKYQMIAPVKVRDIHRYEIIDLFDQVDLNFINTAYPAKSFFFPNELFSYKNNKIKTQILETKRIIFGIRPCDVNALLAMDKIFIGDYIDPHYKKCRENTLLIVMNCTEAGKNCFCGDFGTNKLEKGFDLKLTEQDDNYIIEIGSEKGEKLVQNLKNTDKKPEF
ncbi:MAG: Sulfhydrogenase 2 subunit beta [Candidatus Woesearchaeota archaeon]|nr:Sulfhydrogenase 2 subunit beta [Candidatus Woesearchaeota archaeon]